MEIEGEDRKEAEQEHKVKVRTTEAVPSDKEVEEHHIDYAVFRAWCPIA